MPPKAETKTTYPGALGLSNSVNEITSGELIAKLPNYVTYEGQVSPSSDKVSWNASTRLLRWTTGSIPARTGYGCSPRILYFKVSVTPSRTQIGDILQLVTDISYTGKDSFADTDITVTSSDVTSSTRKGADGFENGQVVE